MCWCMFVDFSLIACDRFNRDNVIYKLLKCISLNAWPEGRLLWINVTLYSTGPVMSNQDDLPSLRTRSIAWGHGNGNTGSQLRTRSKTRPLNFCCRKVVVGGVKGSSGLSLSQHLCRKGSGRSTNKSRRTQCVLPPRQDPPAASKVSPTPPTARLFIQKSDVNRLF